MTMNEQHEEIGRMYVERENVECQSACIENKLTRLRQKLIDAASAIEKRHEDGAQTAIDADLPTSQQIMSLLKFEAEYISRLEKLNGFFEARRK